MATGQAYTLQDIDVNRQLQIQEAVGASKAPLRPWKPFIKDFHLVICVEPNLLPRATGPYLVVDALTMVAYFISCFRFSSIPATASFLKQELQFCLSQVYRFDSLQYLLYLH